MANISIFGVMRDGKGEDQGEGERYPATAYGYGGQPGDHYLVTLRTS